MLSIKRRPSILDIKTMSCAQLESQVCAIAQKGVVTPKVDTIAKNLARLLTASSAAEQGALTFRLSKIKDPEEFLSLVKNAVRISEFAITFSPPNPFDVESQFHRPMEEFLRATKANKGKTSIKGEELENEIIEEISRSAVSTGNMVTARIQSEGDSKPSLKKLGENPVIIPVEEIATDDEKRSVFGLIREAYHRVRGGEG